MASFLTFANPHPHLALLFMMLLMCWMYLVVYKVKVLKLQQEICGPDWLQLED
jgi:hypothetical protein